MYIHMVVYVCMWMYLNLCVSVCTCVCMCVSVILSRTMNFHEYSPHPNIEKNHKESLPSWASAGCLHYTWRVSMGLLEVRTSLSASWGLLCLVPLCLLTMGHEIAAVHSVCCFSGLLNVPWLLKLLLEKDFGREVTSQSLHLSGTRLSTDRGFPSLSCSPQRHKGLCLKLFSFLLSVFTSCLLVHLFLQKSPTDACCRIPTWLPWRIYVECTTCNFTVKTWLSVKDSQRRLGQLPFLFGFFCVFWKISSGLSSNCCVVQNVGNIAFNTVYVAETNVPECSGHDELW